MIYVYDGTKITRKNTRFWHNESKYWLGNGEKEEHFSDVTTKYKKKLEIFAPKEVENIIFYIKYYYSNKQYTCVTKNPSIKLPHKPNKELKFKLPIKSVELLDSNKNVILNVTRKYMKCIGPYKDFHNSYDDIFIKDLFYYDDYEYIKIINILNQENIVSKNVSPQLLL